ncbi:MAG: SGNH/GDSL hydrolase family protein [Leptospirales bacterium]|nr:SGNH/GDSL hydrolase family protein [Leptospirales bacterium]
MRLGTIWSGAFLSLLAIPLQINCQTTRECHHPGIPAPRSVGIIGDSRIFDPGLKNFGGFTNYLNQIPEKNAFAGATFVSEDNDPRTSKNIPGSDAYSSVGNNAFYAERNFGKVMANGHDTVIISLGVNSSGDPEGSIAAIDRMTKSAAKQGLTVILTTLGPWRGYATWTVPYQNGTEKINDWIRQSKARGFVVIDVYDILEDKKKPGFLKAEFTWDQLHYTALGHETIALEANAQMAAARACKD